jgi:hypothetical protein
LGRPLFGAWHYSLNALRESLIRLCFPELAATPRIDLQEPDAMALKQTQNATAERPMLHIFCSVSIFPKNEIALIPPKQEKGDVIKS